MESNRPRVLVLTCHLPFPPLSGGRRRELELFSRLAVQFELHLCAVSKTPEQDRANAGELRDVFRTIRVFDADGGPSDGCPIARHRCPEVARRLRAAGPFDLAHVEGFYLMQHAMGLRCPVVLGEQNVEFALVHQRGGSGALYLATREAELKAWSHATAHIAVTKEDAVLMEESLPGLTVSVVPDGVDHLGTPLDAKGDPEPDEILFLGNFGYGPNVDAARFLLTEILPLIPRGRLILAGNEPPAELMRSAGGRIAVTGRVPSVQPYLERATVVVAPLRIGGGIKVKVLEAMRFAKAIVTTSIGAQGLWEGAGTAFRVADDSHTFAREVSRILGDPRHRRQLECAAAAFADTLPTWDDAAGELVACYENVLARSRTRAGAK